MTCTACTEAATLPHLFHAGCKGCEARALESLREEDMKIIVTSGTGEDRRLEACYELVNEPAMRMGDIFTIDVDVPDPQWLPRLLAFVRGSAPPTKLKRMTYRVVAEAGS